MLFILVTYVTKEYVVFVFHSRNIYYAYVLDIKYFVEKKEQKFLPSWNLLLTLQLKLYKHLIIKKKQTNM